LTGRSWRRTSSHAELVLDNVTIIVTDEAAMWRLSETDLLVWSLLAAPRAESSLLFELQRASWLSEGECNRLLRASLERLALRGLVSGSGPSTMEESSLLDDCD
jgi:hypothetical protein